MAIALPLVPPSGITTSESREAAKILVTVLAREGEGVGVAFVRSLPAPRHCPLLQPRRRVPPPHAACVFCHRQPCRRGP